MQCGGINEDAKLRQVYQRPHKRSLRSDLLGPVNDQVRVDRENFTGSSVKSLRQWPARGFAEIRDFLPDDGFNPVGHLTVGIVLDVAPNPHKIEGGFRRKNVPSSHPDWALSLAR